MKKRKDRWPGRIVLIFFLAVIVAFMVLLIYAGLLPVLYVAVIGGILVLLFLVTALLVRRMRFRVRFWLGTCLAVLVSIVLGLGGVYLYQALKTLDQISGVHTELAEIGVFVKTEDTAASVSDLSGETAGILSQLDRENTDLALEQMRSETGVSLAAEEYAGLTELADGILGGTVRAIVLNSAYMEILEQMEGYEDFSSRVREVEVRQVETAVEEPADPEDSQDAASEEPEEVLLLYISGIDTRGAMTAKSLSDVNIIAVINTRTRQVLLLSTPRDYFVPLSISGGVPDKLTHAGIYGIDVCMDTLGMLYDINIKYYFRLNFAGFVNIIDALGGVTVVSDYEFDSKNIVGYHFDQGENFLNGEQALVFARERFSFAEGDRQRGRNQMAVIRGVIRRVMSPELLKNYSSVMESLQGSFETNVPPDVILSLVREQLGRGGDWNVVTYSVNGTNDMQKPYSMNQKVYVMVPDMSTVEKAKELVRQVYDGQTLVQE